MPVPDRAFLRVFLRACLLACLLCFPTCILLLIKTLSAPNLPNRVPARLAALSPFVCPASHMHIPVFRVLMHWLSLHHLNYALVLLYSILGTERWGEEEEEEACILRCLSEYGLSDFTRFGCVLSATTVIVYAVNRIRSIGTSTL